MSEKLIKPYEISVWEDKLIRDGNEYKLIEKKLAVIGSNTMTGLNKVYDPIFNKKANGEKTLTFSLKYKYFDPYTGNYGVVNPFVALLTNERKVKLHYDNQWYEFIVKEHSESSEEYEWVYTCNDAFVLELSKNGYNLTFDAELNNNQGPAYKLAGDVLKDTDWKLGESDNFKQLIAEPIYKATLVSVENIDIINASGNSDVVPGANTTIYLFYSYIKNKDGKNVQFIIRDDNRQYVIDDNNVINDTNFRITTDLIFNENHFEDGNGTTVITLSEVETKYQAYRLAYGQLTTYDPVMERTVNRFQIGDQEGAEIYEYTDYKYTTSNVITNYITNGDNFNVLEDGTMQGWNPYVEFEDGKDVQKLELVTKPEVGAGKTLVDIASLSQIEGFLKVYFPGALTQTYQNALYNSGITNNSSFIESITSGEKFVFRWRAGTGDVNSLQPAADLRMVVAGYEQDEPTFGRYYKHIDPDNIIMEFSGTPLELNNYITGGKIVESETEGKFNYVIDGVVQTPSIKYIYVDNDSGDEYIWNGLNSTFEPKTSSNYLPYYYLVAEADRGVSNTILNDVTEKVGIFIYNITGEGVYYLEDVQFMRFVPDASDPSGNTPVLAGNVPTATSQATKYYYMKPKDGAAAEDIVTYVSLDELATQLGITDTISPLYNENSEKNLSISASKSNCFDILQTIAETFECWIKLEVLHDPDTGYILYDENGKPEKYVYLKEYAGKDNWAGFKYGINLNSIEREINSTEFVTKLIVEQSQSDYAEEGFVSIASAPSNVSGESYILNFDYYYNQNLLNRTEAEADRIEFVTQVSNINSEIQEKEKERIALENSLINLGANRNTYTELVDTAKTNKTEALGNFENLTHRSYENFQELQVAETTEYIDNVYYIPTSDTTPVTDKVYYSFDGTVMTKVEPVTGNPSALEYYEVLQDYTEEDTIIDLIAEIYVASSTINNYSGLLTNLEKEYWEVREKLKGHESYNIKVWTGIDDLQQRHVFVELSDYLPNFSFQLGESTYTSTVSIKYFDIQTIATEMTFNPPQDYTISENSYTIVDGQDKNFKLTPTKQLDGIEFEINELLKRKDELVKGFNNKYSRFIQEGTWNSTDYIDSELYYLDAVQVSNTSAQPTVTYTINVVEISELEGFEWYLFDAGEKTYIEDTEFFGWSNVNGVLTPAREEVIVSEVEWHLEDPTSNTITVQNYKTKFEDFFQRISATVQTVQYNEATYAKTSTLLDTTGTINQNVLIESLNNVSGKQWVLTSDGTVKINGDEIQIHSLTKTSNYVIINGEGIKVSSDDGNSWTYVIDGQGVNVGAVYTGTLNTNEVIIGNKESPSFRWDKSGISAFKFTQNTNTRAVTPTMNPYDLQTFVRFDQYGLYGIKNNNAFKANNLQDIYNKAHFAVTWEGFFIKNSYPGGGRVEITSDNDFRVMNIPTGQLVEQEKIKIGALEWGKDGQDNPIISPDAPGATYAPTLYGIRIKNNAGDTVMKTGDDGNLEITGTIYAEAGEIGGVIIDSDKLKMDHIILEPGVGIYSDYGVQSGQTNYPFIISDTNGKATFRDIEALGGLLSNLVVKDSIIVGDSLNSGLIKSQNYSAGASGWIIKSDGSAEFQNATVRGHIDANSGTLSNLDITGGITVAQNGYIKSTNYNAQNETGWQITDSSATFNNVTARGHIEAATGTLGNLSVINVITVDQNGAIQSSNWSAANNTGWQVTNTGATFNNVTVRGHVEANTGTLNNLSIIGGITVNQNGYIQSSNWSEQNNTGWKITDTGATFNNVTARGHIEASTGTLGLLDVINTITVGDANHGGMIQSYGYTTGSNGWAIKSDGTAEFQNAIVRGEVNAGSGNFYGTVTVGRANAQDPDYIIIDGQRALIRSANYSDGAGTGWLINNEGDAYFNNITARGAIKTAVFEYAEIQAVGGIFIFRPSSTIKGARISGNDLILKVEKPLLFAKISYTEIDDPDPSANPHNLEWYERTNFGYRVTDDTTVQTKQYYNRNDINNGSWCKISNYLSDGAPADSTIQNILLTNGLTHVYQITNVNTSTNEVTLEGAAAFVSAVKQTGETDDDVLKQLEGGALVDMGRKDGSSNYGIGVNSSDNTVNLPARAISLFETTIDETKSVKVTYKYRGIFGTLPELAATSVDTNVYNNMVGTQGIYTDNIYLGDLQQYLAFYTDEHGNKQLKIRANQIMFEIPDEHGQGSGQYGDVADIEAEAGQPGPPGQDAIRVEIDPIGGNFIKRGQVGTSLIAHVYEGINDITNQFSHFTWYRRRPDGTRDTSWSTQETSNQLAITTADVDESAVFVCEVTVTR